MPVPGELTLEAPRRGKPPAHLADLDQIHGGLHRYLGDRLPDERQTAAGIAHAISFCAAFRSAAEVSPRSP